MNRPLTNDDPFFDELWSETHGGTGDPEYDFENDDECLHDDYGEE
jgi:hypothetical protein